MGKVGIASVGLVISNLDRQVDGTAGGEEIDIDIAAVGSKRNGMGPVPAVHGWTT